MFTYNLLIKSGLAAAAAAVLIGFGFGGAKPPGSADLSAEKPIELPGKPAPAAYQQVFFHAFAADQSPKK